MDSRIDYISVEVFDSSIVNMSWKTRAGAGFRNKLRKGVFMRVGTSTTEEQTDVDLATWT